MQSQRNFVVPQQSFPISRILHASTNEPYLKRTLCIKTTVQDKIEYLDKKVYDKLNSNSIVSLIDSKQRFSMSENFPLPYRGGYSYDPNNNLANVFALLKTGLKLKEVGVWEMTLMVNYFFEKCLAFMLFVQNKTDNFRLPDVLASVADNKALASSRNLNAI